MPTLDEIWDALMQNEEIMLDDLAKMFSANPRTIQRRLQEMVKYGKLERERYQKLLRKDAPTRWRGNNWTATLSGPALTVEAKRPITAVVLSDIHFPYEDPDAMLLAKQILLEAKPDIIILNGDIVDFYGISKFLVPPIRRLQFSQEVEEDAKKIARLHAWAPHAFWVYLEGNHELKMRRRPWEKAPEFAGLLETEKVLNLKQLNILYLQQEWEPKTREEFAAPHVKLGKLYVMHGHSIRMGINAINVAKAVFDRMLKPTLIGHWHRTNVWEQTDYEGVLSGAFVQGCLCRPRPHWDTKVWGQGMSVIFIQDGYFEVDLIKFIAKDKTLFALWRGKRYETRIGNKTWS